MMEWTPILLLSLQAAFAIITVEQLRRRVFVALGQFPQPALVVDVWGPIAVILPMMFLVGRIEQSVHGAGWIAVGAPGMIAILALGAALVAGNAVEHGFSAIGVRSIVIWSGTGLVLLLLGAAHDLTIWMGQCAFGAAAMLLWINSPDEPIPFENDSAAAPKRAGLGMTIALMGAIGQGMTAFFIGPEWAGLSGGIMVGGAVMAVASAAAFAGPAAAVRLGGWAATYGVLMALGLLSLTRLFPHAWRVVFHGERKVPINRIANGFGEFWIEAIALLALGGAAVALLRQFAWFRRMLGWLLIIAAAVLAGWRLSRV